MTSSRKSRGTPVDATERHETLVAAKDVTDTPEQPPTPVIEHVSPVNDAHAETDVEARPHRPNGKGKPLPAAQPNVVSQVATRVSHDCDAGTTAAGAG